MSINNRIKPLEPIPSWAGNPLIEQINHLKKERNAVILAHNYMPPEIYYGIADITGDSFALAKKAAAVEADVILVCGVLFMAETAKLLNPDKTVVIPDVTAGCSLADSITVSDVENLKKKHPGAPVVTYVNTNADIKAAADICCTSGNIIPILESLPENEIIVVPDQNLSAYAAKQTTKTIHSWPGSCEVHKEFTVEQIEQIREYVWFQESDPVFIAAHPECTPEVIAAADFTGSTADIWQYLDKERPKQVFILTEDSMNRNLAVAFPEIRFFSSRRLCPHMEKINLSKILHTLQTLGPEIYLDDGHSAAAEQSLTKMLAVLQPV